MFSFPLIISLLLACSYVCKLAKGMGRDLFRPAFGKFSEFDHGMELGHGGSRD